MYYKDTANRIYWLDNEDAASFLPAECVRITDAEATGLMRPTLNQAKAERLAQLQADRNAAEAANVTVQGKTFSAEPSIAKRFESLAARLRRGKPTSLNAIFEVDGTPVFPVTQALLEQIEDAIAAQGEAAWNRYAEKVGAVMAATTVEQIDVIIW